MALTKSENFSQISFYVCHISLEIYSFKEFNVKFFSSTSYLMDSKLLHFSIFLMIFVRVGIPNVELVLFLTSSCCIYENDNVVISHP